MIQIYDLDNVAFSNDGQWAIFGRAKEVITGDDGRLKVKLTGEKTIEPAGDLKELIAAAKKGKK